MYRVYRPTLGGMRPKEMVAGKAHNHCTVKWSHLSPPDQRCDVTCPLSAGCRYKIVPTRQF